jgi:hypothetical protein
VYFEADQLPSVRDRLRATGVASEEVTTPKSTPRFILHLRCTLEKQTFHLLGFAVPDSRFVAVLAQGRKKQMDLIFQIPGLLISLGGLSEDNYKNENRS